LEETQLGSMTIYSLTSDPQIRELLRRFAEASDDRQFRIKAIYHIVRGSRGNPHVSHPGQYFKHNHTKH